MYDYETGETAAASNTAIAEDLGQIQYLFTDKTGTLTENKMVLKQCSVNGQVYGTINYDSILDDSYLVSTLNQPPVAVHLLDFFRNMAVNQSLGSLYVCRFVKMWWR